MNKWDIGFWPTRADAVYRSRQIDSGEISGACRILLRRNKYHHKGDKLPVYIGKIVREPLEGENIIQVDDIEMLKQIIREANNASSVVVSPQESMKISNEYWRRIIEQIEVMTGEKIDIRIWGPLEKL